MDKVKPSQAQSEFLEGITFSASNSVSIFCGAHPETKLKFYNVTNHNFYCDECYIEFQDLRKKKLELGNIEDDEEDDEEEKQEIESLNIEDLVLMEDVIRYMQSRVNFSSLPIISNKITHALMQIDTQRALIHNVGFFSSFIW